MLMSMLVVLVAGKSGEEFWVSLMDIVLAVIEHLLDLWNCPRWLHAPNFRGLSLGFFDLTIWLLLVKPLKCFFITCSQWPTERCNISGWCIRLGGFLSKNEFQLVNQFHWMRIRMSKVIPIICQWFNLHVHVSINRILRPWQWWNFSSCKIIYIRFSSCVSTLESSSPPS